MVKYKKEYFNPHSGKKCRSFTKKFRRHYIKLKEQVRALQRFHGFKKHFFFTEK